MKKLGTIWLLGTLLWVLAVLPLAIGGQSHDHDLLGGKWSYHEATKEAIAKGLPLVVFVDCELMPVLGNHVMYWASAEEWRQLGGKAFSGAVYARTNVDGSTMRVIKKVPSKSVSAGVELEMRREVRPSASPFFIPLRESFAPFEALLKGLPFEDRPGLVVDDRKYAKGPWPADVPFIHGLVHYKPTRVTQQIDKLNSTSRISRVSRFNPSIETKWHQPGGLEGIKGWQSHLYKLIPGLGAKEWQDGILVRNTISPGPNGRGSQVEIGYKREYPVGTIFIDSLSYDGKPFELRVAEKVERTPSKKDGWHRYVAFRDRVARPPGYHGLKQMCVTCHNTVNNPFAMTGNGPGAGKYTGGLIPGGDTVVSDPFRGF